MKFAQLGSLGPDLAGVDFQALTFDYERAPDHDLDATAQHPAVVVGAGPVGLALAVDIAQRGLPVLLLDNDDRLSSGSRAICFAKRTLEVFDRLGCGAPMVAKGVSWNTGRVFFGDQQVYSFDLLAEEGHERPAFINLQQYYVEGRLAARAAQLPNLQVRWRSKVVGLVQDGPYATLTIETPDGRYDLRAGYTVACDGSRSALRQLLGQESKGQVFRDRFLIADVKMQAPFPAERWFWFDPPFHPGQSVLLHKQADDVWRIDFQLGWDADPEAEKRPENVLPRVRALLGHDAQFELVWASVYTFACQRMERFRHGRVLFAGDSAHGVSPFGARGANSGVQDADNLGWKLAAVLRGEAPDALLDTYAAEREAAADENILASTRATDFITPKTEVSRLFRDAVLQLARRHAFARVLVNSGRLSVPTVLADSPLVTPDGDRFEGPAVPGAPAVDAPLDGGWLLAATRHGGFTALVFGEVAPGLFTQAGMDDRLRVVSVAESRANALAWRRYDARPGTVYLLRPDQHVCARWRHPAPADLRTAHDRSLARETTLTEACA